jgi:hypothetical protein
VSFAEGIGRTVDWLCRPENLARYKSDRFNL